MPFLFVCCFLLCFLFSGALIPGYSEMQAQFVYVMELTEARGKDSDKLVDQAWGCGLISCFFVN